MTIKKMYQIVWQPDKKMTPQQVKVGSIHSTRIGAIDWGVSILTNQGNVQSTEVDYVRSSLQANDYVVVDNGTVMVEDVNVVVD